MSTTSSRSSRSQRSESERVPVEEIGSGRLASIASWRIARHPAECGIQGPVRITGTGDNSGELSHQMSAPGGSYRRCKEQSSRDNFPVAKDPK